MDVNFDRTKLIAAYLIINYKCTDDFSRTVAESIVRKSNQKWIHFLDVFKKIPARPFPCGIWFIC